jgi:hypothetical protein|tara:strand:+ start:890 stop:1912 length:1023 start_codon:yes stop_codon:yes gene_type:complete
MPLTAPSSQELLGLLTIQQTGQQLREQRRLKAYLDKWGAEYAAGTLDKSKRKAVKSDLEKIQAKYAMNPELGQYANQAQIALEEGAPGITLGGAAKWGTGLVGTGAVMAASPYLLRGLWHTGAPQRAVGAGKGVHDLLRGKGGTLGEAWEAGKQPYKERFRAWRAGGTQAATEAAETAVQQAGKQLKETEQIKAYLNKWGAAKGYGKYPERLTRGLREGTTITGAPRVEGVQSISKTKLAELAKEAKKAKGVAGHAGAAGSAKVGLLLKLAGLPISAILDILLSPGTAHAPGIGELPPPKESVNPGTIDFGDVLRQLQKDYASRDSALESGRVPFTPPGM